MPTLEEVKAFNVKVCLSMGWMSYLTDIGGGVPLPLSQAAGPQEQKRLAVVANTVRKIWSGVKTSSEWLEKKDHVSQDIAEHRAAVCIACPCNNRDDEGKTLFERLLGIFTEQAAKAIKRQIERKRELKLSTQYDAQLFICSGCLCPMETKIWSPLTYIKKHTELEVLNELRSKGKDCWVVKEVEAT